MYLQSLSKMERLPTITFTELLLGDKLEVPGPTQPISLNGNELTIGQIVAVARHLAEVRLSPQANLAIVASNETLLKKIASNEIIYGLNTGFGGSADTRPTNLHDLQQCLISHLTCGIVADPTPKDGSKWALPLQDPLAATCMPESWVRASMLIRLNSLAGGASGVRVDIVKSLEELLNADISPRVPLRGSISASGDLSALAWVAAVMQGKPSATVLADCRYSSCHQRRTVTAQTALREAGIAPITLEAKEGLAIVNGTAFSAAVASLAMYECANLAALAQVLTAMTVEALHGSDESFHPFIAQVRPHPGQIDSAQNILAFLRGSKLLNRHDSKIEPTLRQDRYSLRTASQWIGPVLEDFMLAHEQITTECNSVTDNPLVDVAGDQVLHGGNFQARAVTSAVEKLRQGLQGLGRLLFAQCTEMINPATSRGLPPNLAADAAADSYLFKGLDVVVAALASELGFLANPVGTHVQTAEMGNQSLNSLALVSARYTLEAADVLAQLASAHIICVCQALDLRAQQVHGEGEGNPDATAYMGMASKRMYKFVREAIKVPLINEKHLASPEIVDGAMTSPSIGFYNSAVYNAIKSGAIYGVVKECLKEASSTPINGEVKRSESTLETIDDLSQKRAEKTTEGIRSQPAQTHRVLEERFHTILQVTKPISSVGC